jgi:adenylate cyclase
VATGTEIERKFLLVELPADAPWTGEDAIRQGYVALDGDTEVRVRLTDATATLTVKHGTGRRRVEEELPLDARQADALWELTAGRRLEKTRRRLELDGAVVEVDEYAGDLAGLLVAEVEFEEEAVAGAFRPPEWFGEEVTEDDAYKNRRLACDGRPRRGDAWATA